MSRHDLVTAIIDTDTAVSDSVSRYNAFSASGISHRFVLVLECETRLNTKNQIELPQFVIGGPKATIDPRNAKIKDLLPLSKHKLELPNGWEKAHQYMYVLQPSTDEHGWQYRSKWSDGPIADRDEQWVKENRPGLDSRRRLWITTVVKQEDLMQAKKLLCDWFKSKPRGIIMLGDLYRHEQKTLRKKWEKRFCVLIDNQIEVYTTAGGKRIRMLNLNDCSIKMLFGDQCPGREFSFAIRDGNNNLVGLFDAESRDARRRWVVAIRYQLSIHHPDLNFPPFDYGPPTGDDLTTRVLMCGELQKQGHKDLKKWTKRFFQLTPVALQYFDKEALKGEVILVNSKVNNEVLSGPLDFSITSSSGINLIMRADNQILKATWVRCLQRQATFQTERAQAVTTETIVPVINTTVFEKAQSTASSSSAATTVVDVVEDPETVDQPTAEVTEMIRRYTIADDSGPPKIQQQWDDKLALAKAQLASDDIQDDVEQLINARNDATGRKNSVAMITPAGELYLADAAEVMSVESPRETDLSEAVFQGLEITGTASVDKYGERVLTAGAQLVPKKLEKETDPEAEEDLVHMPSSSLNRMSDLSLEEKVGRTLAKRSHPISKESYVGSMIFNIFDKKRYI